MSLATEKMEEVKSILNEKELIVYNKMLARMEGGEHISLPKDSQEGEIIQKLMPLFKPTLAIGFRHPPKTQRGKWIMKHHNMIEMMVFSFSPKMYQEKIFNFIGKLAE